MPCVTYLGSEPMLDSDPGMGSSPSRYSSPGLTRLGNPVMEDENSSSTSYSFWPARCLSNKYDKSVHYLTQLSKKYQKSAYNSSQQSSNYHYWHITTVNSLLSKTNHHIHVSLCHVQKSSKKQYVTFHSGLSSKTNRHISLHNDQTSSTKLSISSEYG